MAEKTWEGRGDKLADARMSWISGRAADDLRLTVQHFRLLAHVGRQNHRRGWLRLSQSELAEGWACSRQRLNGVISDLVQWGYVIKRGQKETGESFCTYKVRLDDPEDDEGGVSRGGDTPTDDHAGGECPAQGTPPVSRPGDRGVPPRMTPVSRPGDTPSLFSSTDYADYSELPPPPPPGGQPVGGRGKSSAAVDWIEDLRTEGLPHHVLDELLGKLVGAGLGTWKDLDPRGPGRQVCLDLAADTIAVVDGIRERVLTEFRYRIPPIAKLRELADEVRADSERRQRETRRRARLVDVPVLAAETACLLEALAEIAPPAHLEAWFEPAGVVAIQRLKGGPRVTVVTPSPPGVVALQADGFVKAAARTLWGADCELEFVQGRAVPATSKPGEAA